MRTGLQDFEQDRAPSALDEARAIFVDAGWGEDAGWLAEACFDAIEGMDRKAADLQSGERMVVVQVARASEKVAPTTDRDSALLYALSALIGDGPEDNAPLPEINLGGGIGVVGLARPNRDGCALLARTWREHGCEFEAAIARGWSPGTFNRQTDPVHILFDEARDAEQSRFARHWLIRTMRALVDGAGLELRRAIDLDALREAGRWWASPNPTLAREKPHPYAGFPDRLSDPVAWMLVLGPDAIRGILETLRSAKNTTEATAIAGGVRDAFERWQTAIMARMVMDLGLFRAAAEAMLPWLDETEQWLGATPSVPATALRELRLWFANTMAGYDRAMWNNLPEARRRTILAAANEDLAKIRPMLEKAEPKPKAEEAKQIVLAAGRGERETPSWLAFEHDWDHLTTCIWMLVMTGGLWKGMKPLLLAIRRIGCPCVASDVRYWREGYPRRTKIDNDPLDQPPDPWARLPGELVNLLHRHARTEQQKDEHLIALRGQFAQFCIDRLSWTKDERDKALAEGRAPTDEDMLEKSPFWRDAYVRAVMALHINPKGKGDKVLKRVAESDPNKDVRRIANDARQWLRRGAVLPENKSPRRAVLEAFWWLRLAHLLELKHQYELNPSRPGAMKIEIDRDGAQRTKAKELDRTQEART